MGSVPPMRAIVEGGYMPLALALGLPAGGMDETTRAAVVAMAHYIRSDLTHEHPDLGRDGPVCPYAAGAVRRDLVRIGASALDRLDPAALRRVVDDLRAAYERLTAATEPRARVYCTAILVLPHLPPGGAALVEQVQRDAKPGFVQDGLMIGEFYPGCPKPGLHSFHFRPFDAPVAAFAVRMMTAYDTPFLTGNADFMASYARFFGAPPPAGEPHGSA